MEAAHAPKLHQSNNPFSLKHAIKNLKPTIPICDGTNSVTDFLSFKYLSSTVSNKLKDIQAFSYSHKWYLCTQVITFWKPINKGFIKNQAETKHWRTWYQMQASIYILNCKKNHSVSQFSRETINSCQNCTDIE